MKERKEKETSEGSDKVLGTLNRLVPGFQGFFKKMEGSKVFGEKVKEIRKEMERRFGKK
ncbi:MAG: hypothetical protein HYW02_06365 [Deltaproteobacteria bacterium]|nr:hypothetical protein [Deltaproteobacteria bacterium]MBI2501075.1 hypothetical protein [Deltaproteobacteria bacterium]MBI4196979.1 hypothetical protein [Deltaproteobacteria bacterium]